MLNIRGLNVTYVQRGGNVAALENIHFQLNAGESVAWVGESGCGKSTLAKAILQILPAAARVSGSIQFQGRELVHMPERELTSVRGREIALVPQEPALALNPVMRAGSQVAEVLQIHGLASGAAARTRALEAMRAAGLANAELLYHETPGRLSGGQRQRVAIAAAIVSSPKLCIADEPATALDPTLRQLVMDRFERMRAGNGAAIIYISHDLAAVARAASRICIFYAGRIVEEGPSELILQKPLHPYTRALVNSARNITETIPGTVPPAGAKPAGCAFHPRCARSETRCKESVPTWQWLESGARGIACAPVAEEQNA